MGSKLGAYSLFFATLSVASAAIDISFSTVTVYDSGNGLDEYRFVNAATVDGESLDVILTVNSTSAGVDYGDGALVNGGSGLGGNNEYGLSTVDGNGNSSDGNESIFFVIASDTDAYVSFNLRVIDTNENAFAVTDTVIVQVYDIDQDTTGNDFSDTFGVISSETVNGVMLNDPTNLAVSTLTYDSTEYEVATLAAGESTNYLVTGNVDNSTTAPGQEQHTASVVYSQIGTDGVEFLWGITGTSGSRRGLFLSATNPPLVEVNAPGVPEPASSVLWLGLACGLFGLQRRQFRK